MNSPARRVARPASSPRYEGPCLGCHCAPAVSEGLCDVCLADVNATLDLRALGALDAALAAEHAARWCFGDPEGETFLAGLRC